MGGEPDAEIIAATLRGARSLARGWIREECEGAALERLARHPCLDTARAYIQGRNAAIDELRTLTGHRRAVKATTVPLDEPYEGGASEVGFDAIEQADMIERWAARQKPRIAEIGRLFAEGCNNREVAARLGVSEGRVTQLVRRHRETCIGQRAMP